MHRSCVTAKWYLWPPQHEGLRLSLTAMCADSASLPPQEAAMLRAVGAPTRQPARVAGRHAGASGRGGAGSSGWQAWHSTGAAHSHATGKNALHGDGSSASTLQQQRLDPTGYSSFQHRVASLLHTAAKLDKGALRHFMSRHMPGSSACANLSPYADPRNFVTWRGGELCNLFESRWHLATAPEISIAFHDPHAPGAAPRFTLDCSAAVQDGPNAPGLQSARYFVSHRFHPYLPLAVTCVAGLNCMIVHHRKEG